MVGLTRVGETTESKWCHSTRRKEAETAAVPMVTEQREGSLIPEV